MINPTGLIRTDLLILDIFGKSIVRKISKNEWENILKNHNVPEKFLKIKKYFLKPDFGFKPTPQSLNIKKEDIEILDYLLWKWNGKLSREWYPYLFGLKHDLQINQKTLTSERTIKSQTIPLTEFLKKRSLIMRKVGFIGLGNMGARMSALLLAAEYEVIGYDVNEEFINQLLPKGLKKASSLNDISKEADIIVTMLPNGEIVEKVLDSILDNLKPGTLIVDCSTIDVDKAKELHKKCEDIKLLFLDAPVSGGVGGAENGTLTFMVGGTQKMLIKKCYHYLRS